MRMGKWVFVLALIGTLGAACASAGAAPLPEATKPIDFNRDIRPILSENCFACHGPDKNKRKADLRLDTKEGLFSKVENGTPVVPGDPDKSEILSRVTSADPDEMMPPPKSKKPKLSAAQVDLLRRWVKQGAKWEGHWAFTPPQRPPVPTTKDAAWARNPVDTFILERLEKEGLHPTKEADKANLIRRLTLDLTGLPPTPAEVDAFLADNSIEAYEKVVDRLLANPHYGERMALDWLDAARYADSNGYQGDGERTMYPWRDWVAQAFNTNLRYDQFTVWQLAGDLLPDVTFEQKLATGFCRNHMINGEGGRIAEENRVE